MRHFCSFRIDELESLFLLFSGNRLKCLLAVTVDRIEKEVSADVLHDMAHVAVELLEDLAIHLVGIFVVLAVFCSPLVQMRHNDLQVAHTVLAGLDRIVAEGFGLCCRVDRRQEFLLTIPIHRVVGM